MRLAALGTPFVDISPLPQLAAMVCYAAIPWLLARRFNINSPLPLAMATLPIAANPYTLWNIARKFDSLPMALSILIMILPVARGIQVNWKGRVLDVALLVCGLCFYQPSINVYLVFLVFELVFHQKGGIDPAEFLKLALSRLTVLVAALIIYHPIDAVTVRGEYARYAGELALGIKDIPFIVHNIYVDWNFLLNPFPREYRTLLLGTIVVGLLLITATQVRYIRCQVRLAVGRKRRLTKIAAGLLGCSLPVAWLLGSIGFLIFLRNFSPPTSYLFVGTGALLSSVLLLVLLELREWNIDWRLQAVVLAPLAYALILFAAVYGNTLKEQKQYEARIGARLASDLQHLQMANPFRVVAVSGNAGFAPIVTHVAKRFRLIRSIVEVQLAGAGNTGFFNEVLRYYGISKPAEPLNQESLEELGTVQPDVTDPSYNLYRKGDEMIVVFKPPADS